MKHEEIPGFTILREELVGARMKEAKATNKEELKIARERLNEVRKKLSIAMFEYKENEKGRSK